MVRDDLTTGVLSLADRDGWSALLTSHEMDDVERLADHVGFLADGALLVEEPMQALLARFRRVEVALADGAAVPASATAVLARLRGRRPRRALRRVAGLAAPPRPPGATRFPGATIDARPMSLREVFVALTRRRRDGRHRSRR